MVEYLKLDRQFDEARKEEQKIEKEERRKQREEYLAAQRQEMIEQRKQRQAQRQEENKLRHNEIAAIQEIQNQKIEPEQIKINLNYRYLNLLV